MVIEKIVLSREQPQSTNVMWAKPSSEGVVFYLFNNGRWQTAQVVDNRGTSTTEDDTVINVAEMHESLSTTEPISETAIKAMWEEA